VKIVAEISAIYSTFQFVHAAEAEKMIVGFNIFDNQNLQSVLNKLSSEINPDWVLPDASSEYRKNLALSLFYKFILNIAPNDIVQVNPTYKSGGQILDRALSSGKQSFDTYEKNWPLTKNIPKIEGLAQTSGEAKYSNDLPRLPNELYGAFVTATKPNMKIGAIDASDALVCFPPHTIHFLKVVLIF
jgi:xanthine dehydrogenase/oxidase